MKKDSLIKMHGASLLMYIQKSKSEFQKSEGVEVPKGARLDRRSGSDACPGDCQEQDVPLDLPRDGTWAAKDTGKVARNSPHAEFFRSPGGPGGRAVPPLGCLKVWGNPKARLLLGSPPRCAKRDFPYLLIWKPCAKSQAPKVSPSEVEKRQCWRGHL